MNEAVLRDIVHRARRQEPHDKRSVDKAGLNSQILAASILQDFKSDDIGKILRI
jgi:hypothetical protein